jgi:predicted Zn finger-like uncharacterized protein
VKFLCEQCKAKYQIADEKIAGKTVRMKCRKCGHQIEVRAAVTETSVNTKPPPADHADPDPTVAQASPPISSQPRSQARPPATARMGPLATSLASARPPPRPGSPGGGALAGAFQKQVEGKPEESAASFDLSELSASDEWYVAINGVPVGPIRIAEVRRKAALGAVTEESLVWQEGLEEWRPVRAFAELSAAVREAATTGRASLLTPAPPEASRSSAVPPAAGGVRPSPPRAGGGVPPRAPMRAPAPSGATLIGPSTTAAGLTANAPRTAAAADQAARSGGLGQADAFGRAQGAPATARSNVVPITSRLATAEKIEDHTVPYLGPPVAPMVAGDPFAAPAVPAIAPAPTVGSSPFVAALGASAAGNVPRPSIFGPEGSPRRATPWIAIAMIVLAAAFGITAAIAIFFRPNPTQPTPVVIQMSGTPALPAPPTTAAPTSTDTATAPVASTSSSSTKPGPIAANANTTAKPGATATPTARGPGVDLSGLTGQRSDPTPTDNGGGSSAAPGQCLSEGQVQSVISQHYAGIKRACWERSGSTKSAANISVSLTVSPGGDATGVSASGDDPVIANCIASDVRSWHFAGGGCAQRVNIPFHFVRQ